MRQNASTPVAHRMALATTVLRIILKREVSVGEVTMRSSEVRARGAGLYGVVKRIGDERYWCHKRQSEQSGGSSGSSCAGVWTWLLSRCIRRDTLYVSRGIASPLRWGAPKANQKPLAVVVSLPTRPVEKH